MANGIEDLREKNRDDENGSTSSKKIQDNLRYDTWRVFQGHEDAEMLQEKSAHWSSNKSNRCDYDAWDDD